jgi:DNA-binding transcriptional regulator YbjK
VAASSAKTGSPRREQITQAALSVLAERGARGLTHRAVDRAACLSEGSTSNYFRTRAALLQAALSRHVELDIGPAADVIAETELRLDREQASRLIVAGLRHILDPGDRTLLLARYELVLESTRRPSLHSELSDARERFVKLAETVLLALGCSCARAHAAQLVACLDGVLLDQLLAAESSLDEAGIEALIGRLLESC